MFVLVGLGNPGGQYALNRHNVGFMALDVIAHSRNFPPFKVKNNALVTEGTIGSHKVLLVKPTTFMNLSGRALQPLVSFYKIPLNNLYVFHDDLDIPFGAVKMKCGGGHGGHNGLASLDQCIGKDYWRIRIGIDHPGHKDAVVSHVLSNFTKTEQESLITILGAMDTHIESLLTEEPRLWLTKMKTSLN